MSCARIRSGAWFRKWKIYRPGSVITDYLPKHQLRLIMGNQREIRQVSPTKHLGVAIQINDHSVETVSAILSQQKVGHFYTYIAGPDELSFPNMDGNDTRLPASPSSRFIIQSGGKMWCGYIEFCDHIADAAEYLHDAHFFVGDEEDYIDEFQITNGHLQRQRVHSGGWRPLEKFINKRLPQANPE